MWRLLKRRSSSEFSPSSTAEEVTAGIDGSGLVAIVTGHSGCMAPNISVLVTTKLDAALQVLIPGSSHGIGAETCRVLALRGVHVVMGVRNLSSGASVREDIVRQVPTAKIEVLELDLSSMSSVRRFVSNFNALNLSLNILINNAGIAFVPFELSEDGIELHFATNHLGHFLLTDLLLEKIKVTAKESGIEGRIVIVASEGYKLAYREGIRFDKINDESGFNRFSAYGQSKLANILHSNELSNHLKEEDAKVVVNSLHPGAVVTNILHHWGVSQGISSALGRYIFKGVEHAAYTFVPTSYSLCNSRISGAATVCYLGLHPRVSGITGKYFIDCNTIELKSPANDKELAKRLWNFCGSLVH